MSRHRHHRCTWALSAVATARSTPSSLPHCPPMVAARSVRHGPYPYPHPRETRTRGHGYGYHTLRVWVLTGCAGMKSRAGWHSGFVSQAYMPPAASSLPPAVCRIVTVVVVVAVAAIVTAVVVVAAVVAAAAAVDAAVAAVVVVVTVVAVVVAMSPPFRSELQRHLAMTPAAGPGVMGAAAVAFETCVAMSWRLVVRLGLAKLTLPGDAGFALLILLQQPRAARAINPHRRPTIDNSKTVSTTTISTTTTTTTSTRRRRHDELDGHQPPPPTPPPPGPCHRQRQDDVNNSNNADDDGDTDTDNNDRSHKTTTTTGHENNWTRRLGRRTRWRALQQVF
ncbi:hypothetical protein EDB85DRAFT_1901721 [Lactarius pseudohatsudake]|nr:hypothetical protein EDB85DRAFT_1901721 [Lactarius pseudohatsudake]